MKTSIIIRTKNEEKWLGHCLKRIFSQTNNDFEVIIVDSGSTDKTLEIANSFTTHIIKIRPEDFSYPYALNIGCQEAKATNFLVFLSAHSLPISNTWLEDGLKNFSDEKVAGVYGPVVALPTGSIWEKIIFNLLKTKIEIFFNKKKIIRSSSLGVLGFTNAVIRKNLWDKRKFNEDYGLGGEDGEWASHWFSLGFIAIKDPKFAVYHSHSLGLRDLIKQRKYWISISKPQPFKKLDFRK